MVITLCLEVSVKVRTGKRRCLCSVWQLTEAETGNLLSLTQTCHEVISCTLCCCHVVVVTIPYKNFRSSGLLQKYRNNSLVGFCQFVPVFCQSYCSEVTQSIYRNGQIMVLHNESIKVLQVLCFDLRRCVMSCLYLCLEESGSALECLHVSNILKSRCKFRWISTSVPFSTLINDIQSSS